MSVCHNTNEFKKKFNKLQDTEKLVYLKCVSHLYNIAIHDDDNIDTLRERFRKQLLDIKMTNMVHFKSHRIVITKKKQPKLVVSEIEKNGLYLIILPDKQNKPFSSVVLTPYAAQIQFIEATDSHKLKFKVVAPYGLLKPNIKEIHATANKKMNTIVFDNINDIMKKQATKSKKRRRRRRY